MNTAANEQVTPPLSAARARASSRERSCACSCSRSLTCAWFADHRAGVCGVLCCGSGGALRADGRERSAPAGRVLHLGGRGDLGDVALDPGSMTSEAVSSVFVGETLVEVLLSSGDVWTCLLYTS